MFFPPSLITSFSTTTGLTFAAASNLLMIIFLYVIVLIVFIPLHRTLLKSLKKTTEKLTREYDSLRYLVAQAQQKHPNAVQQPGIKVIFDISHPDYVRHHDMIQSEIKSIEADLQTIIADETTRKNISTLTAKRKTLTALSNVLGGVLSVITVFVYKLFW